jgi:hypothetical protein
MPTVPNLWFTTFIGSLSASLAAAILWLPSLLGGLILLLIGWAVAKIVQGIVAGALRAWHVDPALEREGVTPAMRKANVKSTPTHIIGVLVYWYVFLLFLRGVFAVVGLRGLEDISANVINYIPRVLLAIIIVVLGTWLANFLGKVVRVAADASGAGYASGVGIAVQFITLFLVFVTGIGVLGVDITLLTTLFAIVLGAAGLALALAFGLGGRTYATDVIAGRELSSMFSPGDKLVADGMAGTVTCVNPTYTVLRTDKGEVALNNRELMDKHVRRDVGSGGTSSMGGDMPKAA